MKKMCLVYDYFPTVHTRTSQTYCKYSLHCIVMYGFNSDRKENVLCPRVVFYQTHKNSSNSYIICG